MSISSNSLIDRLRWVARWPPSLQWLPLKADSVGAFRVLVSGFPTNLVEGSAPIWFRIRNTETGEETTYKSVFMGPHAAGQ